MEDTGLYKEIHVRHLEQLAKLDLPPSSEWKPPVDAGGVLPSADELIQWIKDNKIALDAAIVNFGKGGFKSYTSCNSPASLDLGASLLTLITSSAMYLRDDKKVLEARETYLDYKMSNGEDNGKLHMAIDLLALSLQNIQPVAAALGLKFNAWAELIDFNGDGSQRDVKVWTAPYSGAWYSPDDNIKASNFVLLAFKGTTPTNIKEIILDLESIKAIQAEGYLWNTLVAAGFYKGLFTNPNSDGQIPIAHIQEQCTALTKSSTTPMPLYYTGHSLGAAYATLAFAQTCIVPSAWGNIKLAEIYTHGSPRTAVAQPAGGQDQGLAGHIMQAIGNAGGASHSWRIAFGVGNKDNPATGNDQWQDAVTLVPPPLSTYSTAFIHIDEGHQIQKENEVNKIMTSEVASEKPLLFISINPIIVGKAALSHMPSRYYEALLALLYP